MENQKYSSIDEWAKELPKRLDNLSKWYSEELGKASAHLISEAQLFKSEWEQFIKRLEEFNSSRAPNEANELSEAQESTTPQESCDSCDSCECPDCLEIEFYQDKLECIKADLITLADFMARNDYANAKNILRDMLFNLEIFYTCFTEVDNARHH